MAVLRLRIDTLPRWSNDPTVRQSKNELLDDILRLPFWLQPPLLERFCRHQID